MGKSFPLAHSQRVALHRFIETEEDDCLAVMGPPGTGKTTLIQSVVASLWVNSAREKSPYPPLIVATGATNQSVMNIIDSFAKVVSDDERFASRWLPQVESFGTFCCSEKKAKEISGYQLELKSGRGFSANLETALYLRQAESYFLECSASFFGKRLTLSKAEAALHRCLREELWALQRQVLALKDSFLIGKLKSLFFKKQETSSEEAFAALAGLDTTHRHRAFLFATHYWEARWLRAAKDDLGTRSKTPERNVRFRSSPEDWGRRAMLTPIFVSTLEMTGRFFGGRPQRPSPPLDVLIFDEAGQISPELGMACMSLAKRALIVGDDKQLEPVWNVSEYNDQELCARAGLWKPMDEKSWHKLFARGLLASRANLMRLAIESSRKTQSNRKGVFLSEHRRSVPEIVSFCNTLAYQGRLEPKRDEPPRRLLPPIGYLHVAGVCERRGKSRFNRIEARSVADWVIENENRLLQFYGARKLDEILAVISPFAAQIQELERLLYKPFPELTVGTVHSLQGAEVPIVLFSSVYDEKSPSLHFIDQSENLLNVAVSRAKDSFLVFGNKNIFNPHSMKPSGILANYLFRYPTNELKNSGSRSVTTDVIDTTMRLSTFELHTNALTEGLTTARFRVIISASWISSNAIRHDRIDEYVRDATQRGVRVIIYADFQKDLDEKGQLKPLAVEGRKLLIQAGAEFYQVRKIHNKSLAVDDHTLIEGSFNWLSAARVKGSEGQNHEASAYWSGASAAPHIEDLMKEMEYLRVDQPQQIQNG